MALRVSKHAMDVRRALTTGQNLILDFANDYRLTEVELLQMLTETQASVLKGMLRAERNPDNPDRAADLEGDRT